MIKALYLENISLSEFIWDNIYLILGLFIGILAVIILRKNLKFKP